MPFSFHAQSDVLVLELELSNENRYSNSQHGAGGDD